MDTKKKYSEQDVYEACFDTMRWTSDERPSETEQVEFAQFFKDVLKPKLEEKIDEVS